MPMKKVHVEIKGISPLLMHAFPLVPLEAIDKKTPAEQAEHSTYRDPDNGVLYVPAANLQRALVSAATYSKGKGRSSLQKAAAACLMVTPDRISLGVKNYIIDSRPVVNPMTKGRMLGHRPRLDEWKLKFQVEFDDTLLSEKELRQIVDDMGSRVGILDFRPERKGPFGRSIVTKWELDGK